MRLMTASQKQTASGATDVYFGSYTQSHPYVPHACGAGIVVCSFDSSTGTLHQRQVIDGILNPAYLALDASGTRLFAVSENFDEEGSVCVLSRDADGSLTPTAAQPSGGLATCHVCVTAAGNVCASSYKSGSLAVYSFDKGVIGPSEGIFRYEGCSVNAARQESSHAHHAMASPNLRWLYVCDLGADRIWCHPITGDHVGPSLPDSIRTPAGCGPRHLEFHPTLPRLYVVCELNAHLLTYDWNADSGSLSLADDQPTLPAECTDQPAAAAIRLHPFAPALYVSNRNHDSLTAFQLDCLGSPKFACRMPAEGKNPRDFAIDPSGAWLLVANQESNSVAVHALDPWSGLPAGLPPKIFSIPTPTCVLFAQRES